MTTPLRPLTRPDGTLDLRRMMDPTPAEAAADRAAAEAEWGPWRLDPDTYTLWEPGSYYVELLECTTSARTLDRIIQIAGKNWADAECLAGLIRALADVLDPQANLCSSGTSRRVTKARIRALVDAYDRRGRADA